MSGFRRNYHTELFLGNEFLSLVLLGNEQNGTAGETSADDLGGYLEADVL